jgi:hypothetical protein
MLDLVAGADDSLSATADQVLRTEDVSNRGKTEVDLIEMGTACEHDRQVDIARPELLTSSARCLGKCGLGVGLR